MRHYLSALLHAPGRRFQDPQREGRGVAPAEPYPAELMPAISAAEQPSPRAAPPAYAHGRLVITLPKTAFDRSTGRIVPLAQGSATRTPRGLWRT